jgi:hypothetical protein
LKAVRPSDEHNANDCNSQILDPGKRIISGIFLLNGTPSRRLVAKVDFENDFYYRQKVLYCPPINNDTNMNYSAARKPL